VADLAQLESDLGYVFADPALLRLALTHPSAGKDRQGFPQDNQRLEFLGDAVLGLVLTRVLYERFPEAGEGELTQARARLVNKRILAEHGQRLGLGAQMLLSSGEEASGGRHRPSALADAMEAVLGAIFLDGGLNSVRDVVLSHLAEPIETLCVHPESDNPKGELQEWLQARGSATPCYQVEQVAGPEHARRFQCSVQREGIEIGRGWGASKKEAETQAALEALRTLRPAGDGERSEIAPGSSPF
jgi:ribonuclease-3